jgi:hypothetical protein
MVKFVYLGFLLFNIGIHAQVILTKNDFAGDNDTVRYSQAVLSSLTNYSATGENYLWDFSGLQAESQYLKRYRSVLTSPLTVQAIFGPFAPERYRGTYYLLSRDVPIEQFNNFLPVVLSDLNTFSKSSNDSITSIGYSISVNNVPTPFQSDTIETRYKFPLEFGDSNYSRGYTLIDLNPAADIRIKQYRQRNTTADGYGTLISPFGTYQVLRLKHFITEVDSIYQTFFGVGQWFATPIVQTIEYEWFTNGGDDALLRIVESVNNDQSQIRFAEYKDVYRGLDLGLSPDEIHGIEIKVELNKLYINSQSKIDRIQVSTLEGQMIKSERLNDNVFIVEKSSLLNGVFIIKIHLADVLIIKRIFIN